jgi:hypothetical protein
MPPPPPDASSVAGRRLRRLLLRRTPPPPLPPPPPAFSVRLPSSSAVLRVGTGTTARWAAVVPSCRHGTKILRRARAGRGAQPVVPARHGTKWRRARRARAASCLCRLVPVPCCAGRAGWPSIMGTGPLVSPVWEMDASVERFFTVHNITQQ